MTEDDSSRFKISSWVFSNAGSNRSVDGSLHRRAFIKCSSSVHLFTRYYISSSFF